MTSQAQTTAPETARDDHGRENALAWFKSIVEMVDAMRKAADAQEAAAEDATNEAIQESILSVEVRSGWFSPGSDAINALEKPAEFRILLSTGGPAAQLVGDLNEYGEPETARLEYQDWFKPWTGLAFSDLCAIADKTVPAGEISGDALEAVKGYLLAFAQQFYFGE